MTKLIRWAIENAPAMDRKVLSDLINMLDVDKAERFATALIGLVNLDEEHSALPQRIESYGNKSNLVLLSTNYLDDQVSYTCDEEITRYYKTEEQAVEFARSGRGRYDGYSSGTDECKFVGTHVFSEQRGYCSFATWKAMAEA